MIKGRYVATVEIDFSVSENEPYSDAALMCIKALILDADSGATEGVIVWKKRNC